MFKKITKLICHLSLLSTLAGCSLVSDKFFQHRKKPELSPQDTIATSGYGSDPHFIEKIEKAKKEKFIINEQAAPLTKEAEFEK